MPGSFGGDPRSPERPDAALALGRFVAQVGPATGTVVELAEERDPSARGEARQADPAGLARALADTEADRQRDKTATARLSTAVDEATEVTDHSERAKELFSSLAAGKDLDPAQLLGEIDGLLGLLERLDREGRFEEELQLARSFCRLLALLMRWADLARSLRMALAGAERIGDLDALGWARHELGSWQLVSGDISGAERSLRQARDIRERLGDRRALAATERNLQVLCHELRDFLRDGKLVESSGPRRRLRASPAVLLGAAAALLAVGGVAGAVVTGDDNDGSATTGREPGGVRVAIREPVEGARYRAGETVIADYRCSASSQAPAVRSCRGNVRDGSRIDTSSGRHTFAVTATLVDGRRITRKISYSISKLATPDTTKPQIRIAAPRPRTFKPGRRLRADYSCQDEPGGSGIARCEGGVPDGELLDWTPGTHTFTVVARDAAGNVAQKRVRYSVTRGVPASSQCDDRADNDGDDLIDGRDPGCADGRTEEPADKTSPDQNCDDGLDNDGDGWIDEDPGCTDDGNEAPPDPAPPSPAPPTPTPLGPAPG